VPDPTEFDDLNRVLAQLLAGARTALGENFCGLYLQGSFAIGDADVHSDIDFIVVTNGEVTDAELELLQALHARLYAIDVPWAQHLEGSYVPRTALRRTDPERRAYPYLDNGATELVLDNHCNTDVVRWSLREHGIPLAGPDPKTLVDPVSADQLRREELEAIGELATWAPEPTRTGGMSEWKQVFLVTSLCRMLHTLDCGRVTSKRAACEWALDALDGTWRDLVQRALDDRADPWVRVHQPADEDLAGRTLAFARWALAQNAPA